jgi:CheY-like chemotaxis protein
MGDLLARTIGPQVRVETRLEADLWQALADPTQVEVMILNLAINARDAMPGGGRLTISTKNVQDVPAQLASELTPGQYVAITVSDTGTGMPPAVLARAFEPFFTTKEQGKGTGLGLAQLYGFAKQSGGTAKIESREGEGTSVTIYLPRTLEVRSASTPDLMQPGPPERVRILLVDDDDDVREVAKALVEEIGYEVEAASSGEAALNLVRHGRFAAVITDVAMPGMNGVDLAREIRTILPNLPVIFASGYADLATFGNDLVEETLLKKPYRIADLAARLNAAVTARQAGGNVIELRSR